MIENKEKVIMIVDDDSSLQQFATELLQDEGYQVVSTFDAHSALARLRYFQPDVILLDVRMPEMDGFTFLTKLREELNSPVPVIGLTASSLDEERLREHEGITAVLAKPFDINVLLKLVSTAITARM